MDWWQGEGGTKVGWLLFGFTIEYLVVQLIRLVVTG